MRYPPRLSHLATSKVIVSKLVPTYSQAHNIDDDEGRTRLEMAVRGALLEQLLEATWNALSASRKRVTDEGLLEKVAQSLKDRPLREGRPAKVTPAFSAFLVLLDIEAGTATDAARKVIESPANRDRVQAGIAEAGQFLAAELTRK